MKFFCTKYRSIAKAQIKGKRSIAPFFDLIILNLLQTKSPEPMIVQQPMNGSAPLPNEPGSLFITKPLNYQL